MRKVVALVLSGIMLVSVCLSAVASSEIEGMATETPSVELTVEAEEEATGAGIETEKNDTDESGQQTEEPGEVKEEDGDKQEGDDETGEKQNDENNENGGNNDNNKDADEKNDEAEDKGKRTAEATDLANQYWQAELTFPRWISGAIDDTLIVNDTCSFQFCKGQGYVDVKLSNELRSFDLFINNKKVSAPKKSGRLDISKYTVNGRNTIRVSNIRPLGLTNAVQVSIPYPVVVSKKSTPAKAGLDADAFKFIDQIIKADVAHGYTGAQLAVIKGGAMIYSNAWGYVNRYDSDGNESKFPEKTTTNTLYDLAGLSTLYTAAAVESLITNGEFDLDTKVADILGEEFVEDTIEMDFYPEGGAPSLETIKEWKRELTVDQLLRYQSGLPATGYYHMKVYPGTLRGEQENPLYVADGKKATTYKMLCKTPLLAKPGTVYSPGDVDYMLLGWIVEKVSGVPLDSYVKSVILNPMGLIRTTYNPTKNGFRADECATTELTGNSRKGLVSFPGVRTSVVQGQVHDELSYYTMEGVAGHAGVFANAENLAKFGTLFITGGYGAQRIIDAALLRATQTPNAARFRGGVAGWELRGTDGSYDTACLAGASAGPNVLCLNGFTRCMLVVDVENQMVIAYCSNAISTPITFLDPQTEAPLLAYARFSGNYYTSATMGFTSEIIYEGLKSTSAKPSASYKSAMRGMLLDKYGLVATRDATIHRLRGVTDNASLLTVKDSIVQAYYALYEVANARIGKSEAKKIAREYLDAERDAVFLRKTYNIK